MIWQVTQRLETVDVIVKKLKEKPKPKGYGGKEETEEKTKGEKRKEEHAKKEKREKEKREREKALPPFRHPTPPHPTPHTHTPLLSQVCLRHVSEEWRWP